MVLVLFPASEEAPTLRPAELTRLARLGITSACLLGDGDTAGLVLEGWAFDPAQATDAVRSVIPGDATRARTLHQLFRVAVSTVSLEGGLP